MLCSLLSKLSASGWSMYSTKHLTGKRKQLTTLRNDLFVDLCINLLLHLQFLSYSTETFSFDWSAAGTALTLA